MLDHKVKDLSPVAIKKTVLNNAIQMPLSVYPAAISVLGGFYSLLFGLDMLGIAAMVGGGVIAIGNWVYEYFIRGSDHANEFVLKYRKELEKRRQETLNTLEKDLQHIGSEDGLRQLRLFREKYNNFQSVLGKKLDQTELTYNRYLTIAEQVLLGGLDNLDAAAISLKSISAIKSDDIQKELERLSHDSSEMSRAKQNEYNTRLELRKNQLDRVSELMLLNESALTHLDHVSTKIANINTKQGRALVDLEDSMDELRHLIERADKYAK